MLYLEFGVGVDKGLARVFSDTDNLKELNKFRCQIRAPKHAVHNENEKDKKKRPFLSLFGAPRDRASQILIPTLVFSKPEDRIQWEKTQPKIMKRHPIPYHVQSSGAVK